MTSSCGAGLSFSWTTSRPPSLARCGRADREGVARACRETLRVALRRNGGNAGVYADGGTTSRLHRGRRSPPGLIDGSGITAGDVLIALHPRVCTQRVFTARKIVFDMAVCVSRALAGASVRSARSSRDAPRYLPAFVLSWNGAIKGMAHITGVASRRPPRVLPEGLRLAYIARPDVPSTFTWLQKAARARRGHAPRVQLG